MLKRQSQWGWMPLGKMISADMFKAEVRAWARQIGVEPTGIHVRFMQRKWASCSSKGRLTFNAELLYQPISFRAEIIIHELLHLKISNHGKLFKALLRSYLNVSAKKMIEGD